MSFDAALRRQILERVDTLVREQVVARAAEAGLSRAGPVERLMRDAEAFQIYDGASQIQKSVIGRQLQKSGLPFDYLDPGGV
jgi:alkylation response protein AidB-like acyl-CoA dehydrogenase